MNNTRQWPLERVLFALAGTVTLLSGGTGRNSFTVVVAADRVRRDQPVAVRGCWGMSGVRGFASRLRTALGDDENGRSFPLKAKGVEIR